MPIITIPKDEYIIGALYKSSNKNVNEFYQTQFNLNADKIIIDIRSTIEKLLVNIGDKRPNTNDKNFEFNLKNDPNDHDNVFIISKEEILKIFPNITDLTNYYITLGLYSSKFDNGITAIPYSFSIRLSNESGNDIYKINSEHLSLRNSKQSKKVGGKYQCFYLIKYDYLNESSSVIISAKSSDKSNVPISIKAKYVDYEDYIFGKIDLNSNYEFSNKENENYIFLKNGFMKDNKAKCIFVLVELSEEKIIQFYTSFYNNYNSIFIEPSSQSINYVPKGESLSLYASKLFNNSINFEHLYGKGEIYRKGKYHHYFLNTSNSSFTLTFNNTGREIEIIAKDINEDKNSNGFMFYLEQYMEFNLSKKEEQEEQDKGDKTDGEKDKNKGDNSTLIIIVVSSVVGVIIIAGLIVLAICYNKKKNIKTDISKISFKEDRDSNLLLDENN